MPNSFVVNKELETLKQIASSTIQEVLLALIKVLLVKLKHLPLTLHQAVESLQSIFQFLHSIHSLPLYPITNYMLVHQTT